MDNGTIYCSGNAAAADVAAKEGNEGAGGGAFVN